MRFRLLFESLRLFGRKLRRCRFKTLGRRWEELRRLRLELRLLLLLFLLLLSEQVLRLLERQGLLLLDQLLLRTRGSRESGGGGGRSLEVEFDRSLWLELRLERLEGRPELRLRLLELRRGLWSELLRGQRLLSSRLQWQTLVDVDASLLFGHLLEYDRVVLAGGRVEYQFGGVQR